MWTQRNTTVPTAKDGFSNKAGFWCGFGCLLLFLTLLLNTLRENVQAYSTYFFSLDNLLGPDVYLFPAIALSALALLMMGIRAATQRARPRKRLDIAATLLFLLALLCLVLCSCSQEKRVFFEDYNGAALPFPLLSELNEEEGRVALSLNVDPPDAGYRHPLNNSLYMQSSFLAPQRITSYQFGPYDWVVYEDGSRSGTTQYSYVVSSDTLLCKSLATRFFAEKQARLIECPRLIDREGTLLFLIQDAGFLSAAPGISAFYSRRSDGYQRLLLGAGRRVLEVSYSGATDLRTVLPLFGSYLQ